MIFSVRGINTKLAVVHNSYRQCPYYQQNYHIESDEVFNLFAFYIPRNEIIYCVDKLHSIMLLNFKMSEMTDKSFEFSISLRLKGNLILLGELNGLI